MKFIFKYFFILLFLISISKCLADDAVTELKEEPPKDDTPDDSKSNLDPNKDTTPSNVNDLNAATAASNTPTNSTAPANPTTPTTPATPDNSIEALNDCDNLKLVFRDYNMTTSTWGDHTMDCCDNAKIVCKDFQGQKFITELNLSYNRLEGGISNHIGNFTNLEKLDLKNNRLTGTVPVDFKFLKNLKYLYLNSNNLSGDFPDFIGEMSNLRIIDITDNGITGRLPESLNQLSYLETLNAKYNSLSGEITDFFMNTPNLTILDLSLNKLEGSIPKSVGQLTNLTELYFANNKDLNGRVPDMPKSLILCSYENTELCLTEDAVCGLGQAVTCKSDTKKYIIMAVVIILALVILGFIVTKLLSAYNKRNKEKQSDEALLVGGDDNDGEEGEFVQLREKNDSRHYVEVDEDYIFDPKHMNRFIS